ncbi:hypothetical protein HYFRA_00012245 [Hymenoscyphus fraxineus]|uniref:Very long-chain fatty acid transport protein n=1 Tax=Hymenoscyphus fraxineus TaxID=746836 RepID=A0A9N9L133_9HELO|nr:hypothetical protein HYFRA_00012245 [Hymenoscyphus fraxineus]
MPVPLPLAVPAAIATLAYLNARTGFSYDLRLLGPAARAASGLKTRLSNDKLNPFYDLEAYAKGSLADKVYLIFGGRKWTYNDVYQNALRYGTWIKAKYHVQAKEIVAMDFMNSENYIFIWLGLWSIGAKPAFINYNLTDKALVHCINVSTARVLLVDPQVGDNITQEVRDALPEVTISIFTPELENEAILTQPIRVPNSDRSENDMSSLAMIIFTSGTTGLPKGAIVSWNKVVKASLIIPGWNGFKETDIFYTSMPLYHASASILGAMMVMINGGTICIGRKFSTKHFWEDCRSSKATVIQYVGETCRYLLAAPPLLDPVTGENLDRKNSVRMAFGNGLRPDIWNRFKERFGISEIAEFYTATEGTAGSWNFSRNDFGKGAVGRLGTLGRLITGFGAVLLELDWETEKPYRDPKTGLCKSVKAGEPGELVFKLDPKDISTSFQGYFNNKKANESKIVRDVLTKGDAWFRTGDMIIWDDEGRSFFSDRIGDTFRWKAENVSTNEVSEALGLHPAVQEANVYGVELPHHDGRAGCVALVLNTPVTDSLMHELAHHCQQRLPKFAVPVFLRLMSDMGVTGTNKQQKHHLRIQGVDPDKVGGDEVWWLQGGTYVRFQRGDWEALRGEKAKL